MQLEKGKVKYIQNPSDKRAWVYVSLDNLMVGAFPSMGFAKHFMDAYDDGVKEHHPQLPLEGLHEA